MDKCIFQHSIKIGDEANNHAHRSVDTEITESRIGTNAFSYFCGICWRKIRGAESA